MSDPREARVASARPVWAALVVPAAIWMLGMAAYALADALIEDRAIALIFAAVLLVTLAPLAAGGVGRDQV